MVTLPSLVFLIIKPHPFFIPLPLEKGKGEVVREGLRPSKTPYKHIEGLRPS